ncbi:MAG: DUF4136 domain-containing protein [Proteobacteria bacterium]|nr:DUF4136 domain-containing protein [Pseudomonadota bacterium]
MQVLSQIPAEGLPHTYAWTPRGAPQTAAEADPRVNNSIVETRLMQSIDRQLAAKGYHLVSSPAEAGMLAAFRVGVKDKTRTDVDTMGAYPSIGYGLYGCRFAMCYGGPYSWGAWGPPDVTVSQHDYAEGRVIVDLSTSSQPEKLLWRSSDTGTLNRNSGTQQQIDKLVGKMLAALPAPATAH